jgi:hypothetical protein
MSSQNDDLSDEGADQAIEDFERLTGIHRAGQAGDRSRHA